MQVVLSALWSLEEDGTLGEGQRGWKPVQWMVGSAGRFGLEFMDVCSKYCSLL